MIFVPISDEPIDEYLWASLAGWNHQVPGKEDADAPSWIFV